MAVFTWNDSLSVKIRSLDDEHKKLIEMINEFYDNIVAKSNEENISELISKMKDYTVYHFGREERHLKLHKYPKLEEHIEEHKKFIDKVSDMERRFAEGKIILSLEVTSFLKDWLQYHIMVTDKMYTDFLLRKGVS